MMDHTKRSKVVAVDIGNTSVTMGLFVKGVLTRRKSLLTPSLNGSAFHKIPWFGPQIEVVVVASVVPKATRILLNALKRRRVRVIVLGKDIPVPIPNKTERPKEVGMDRLVNALQAFHTFKQPCIALDFGTAITFDIISKKGEYLGGVILPGVEMALGALFEKTALLPKVRLSKPRGLLGRNTKECMISGCTYGFGALCDGLIAGFNKLFGYEFKTVATGGYAKFISKFCRSVDKIDPDLTLNGIHTAYRFFTAQKNKKIP